MESVLNNVSYEDYIKDQLAVMSPGFTVKAYKRADKEEWAAFINGTDLRIQIQFKKKSLFEFLVESSFWHQRNSNKEDRVYMRKWADPKIQMIKNAQIKNKPKRRKKKTNTISKTQDSFEKMKKK